MKESKLPKRFWLIIAVTMILVQYDWLQFGAK